VNEVNATSIGKSATRSGNRSRSKVAWRFEGARNKEAGMELGRIAMEIG
jgi:hypothetical protein